MFLRVETQWACYSPHRQGDCPGTLVVISDGDTHSVACGKCNLGTVGAGPLPEFWIKRLISHGYLNQFGRIPAAKEELHEVIGPDWCELSRAELVDRIFGRFEVFVKNEK